MYNVIDGGAGDLLYSHETTYRKFLKSALLLHYVPNASVNGFCEPKSISNTAGCRCDDGDNDDDDNNNNSRQLLRRVSMNSESEPMI